MVARQLAVLVGQALTMVRVAAVAAVATVVVAITKYATGFPRGGKNNRSAVIGIERCKCFLFLAFLHSFLIL